MAPDTVPTPAEAHEATGILDLPRELLREIFSHFQDPKTIGAITVDSNGHPVVDPHGHPVKVPRDPGNAIAIANARLTCSVLRDVADEFLLGNVVVSLDEESLDMMDEISRHPTIGRGVRSVIVTLDYRPAELVESLRMFIVCRVCEMRSILSYRTQDSESALEGLADQERAWVEEVNAAWVNEVNAVEGPESHEESDDESGVRQFIRESHDEYKRQHEEQYHLIESGSFVRELVASISLLPRFESLGLKMSSKSPVERMESGDFMSKFFASAFQMRGIEPLIDTVVGELASSRLLFELPIAIHAAGATLRHYAVAMLPIDLLASQSGDPTGPAWDWDDLRAAFQNLESVTLQDVHGPYQEASSPGVTTSLNSYVGAAVSGPRLETIVVNGGDTDPAFYPFGAVLSSIRSPVVHFLVASRVSIHQHELETFYAHPDTRPTCSIMFRVNIRSGSWKSTAEFLQRQKMGDEGKQYTLGFTSLTEGWFTEDDIVIE